MELILPASLPVEQQTHAKEKKFQHTQNKYLLNALKWVMPSFEKNIIACLFVY